MRFLLLQTRNPDDAMRVHEHGAFAKALDCEKEAIRCFDLLKQTLTSTDLDAADVVLIGGSGEYSACSDDPWLHRCLEGLKHLCESGKPTFASCWGFQAFARALGGKVIEHDDATQEVGTIELTRTPEAAADPVFGHLPEQFNVQIGHQDTVVELPKGAVLLASSNKVKNEAYNLAGLPVYATQFHPELDHILLLDRLRQYPQYVKDATGLPFDVFCQTVKPSPEASTILPRFMELVRTGQTHRLAR